MITTGCRPCNRKQADTNDYTALCDKHRLEYLEHEALVAVDNYLDSRLDSDDNYHRCKWAQRRARLANLLRQIELDDRKESEVKI